MRRHCFLVAGGLMSPTPVCASAVGARPNVTDERTIDAATARPGTEKLIGGSRARANQRAHSLKERPRRTRLEPRPQLDVDSPPVLSSHDAPGADRDRRG